MAGPKPLTNFSYEFDDNTGLILFWGSGYHLPSRVCQRLTWEHCRAGFFRLIAGFGWLMVKHRAPSGSKASDDNLRTKDTGFSGYLHPVYTKMDNVYSILANSHILNSSIITDESPFLTFILLPQAMIFSWHPEWSPEKIKALAEMSVTENLTQPPLERR